MYPFLRISWAYIAAHRAPPLALTAAHHSRHFVHLWDLDPYLELNNGRTLTLYDLGRIPLFIRTGLFRGLKRQGWRSTVAGSTIRYRRRVRPGDRLEMISRVLGWDARFFYIEQSLWRGADCASHVVIRDAVVRKPAAGGGSLVPTGEVLAALNYEGPIPKLPPWVQTWAEAEALRPWPPERPA